MAPPICLILFLDRTNYKQDTTYNMAITVNFCKAVKSSVSKAVQSYYDKSLQGKDVKSQRRFEKLTKADKRAWREALQRQIALLKQKTGSRAVTRAFISKPRGKNAFKVLRNARLESALYDDIYGDVELQGGRVFAAAAVAAGGFAVHKLTKLAKAASKAGKNVGDAVNAFKEQFDKFIESIKHVGSWLFKFMVTAVGLWFLNRYVNAPAIILIVSSAVVASVPEARHLFGVTKQAFGEVTNIVALLCTLLVPTLGSTSGRIANNFMRTVSVFPKFSDGLTSFMDKVVEFAETFCNWILRRDESNKFTFAHKKEASEVWRKDVIALCKRVDTDSKVPLSVVRDMQRKVHEGYALIALMTHKQSKDEIARWVDKLNNRLSPHLGALAAENNMRVMPWCVMLGGASGIGKTSVVQVFSAMVLILSGEIDASEILQNIWQKGISEYWNGYVGQKCLVKDDCFQVRGISGDQGSEAMEVIKAIGPFACPLNYADVDSKGRYYLDISLMVGTTNAKNIKADWEPYITCPEALVRRFQGSYWLELNPKYALNGRYDFDRISNIYHDNLKSFAKRRKDEPEWRPTQDDLLDLFPWDAWVVRQHGFDNSAPEQAPILPGGLKAEIKLAARTIKERKEAHAKTVQNITEHVTLVQDALSGIDFQAGMKVTGDIHATTSEAFVKSKLDDGAFVYATVDMQAKLTLDEDGSPILLDLEQADETWFKRALRTIHDWYRCVIKQISGLSEMLCGPEFRGEGDDLAYNEAFGVCQATLIGLALGVCFRIVKAAISLLWTMVSTFMKSFGVKPQSNDPPAKEKGMSRYRFPKVKLQVGEQHLEQCYKNIYKNMYGIGVSVDGTYTHLGNILGVGDTVFIMPAHFDAYVRKYCTGKVNEVVLRLCTDAGICITMSDGQFLKFPRAEFVDGTDLVGITFCGYAPIRTHRNIVGHFLKESEISNVLRGTNVATRLDVGRFDERDNRIVQHTFVSNSTEYVDSVQATDGSRLEGLVKYYMPTASGDCGAPLTLADNKYYGGKTLLGIHVAGKTNLFSREGYATITTQEAIREVWLQLAANARTDVRTIDSKLQEISSDDFVRLEAGLREGGLVGGSVSYLGPANEPIHMATKSAIKHTNMHEDMPFGECPVAPAVLRPIVKDGVMIFPMANAVAAYQSEVVVKEPESLALAAEMAFKPLFKETSGFSRDILTFEEAIVPPEGWKLKSLNRKSSAGHKYRSFVTPSTPGKVAFLGRDGDVDFSMSRVSGTPLCTLREDVEEIISCAKVGNRLPHICVDFLKDELRPLEKVQNVKTRMISGTELDYTIAVRQYFGAFCAAMLATPIANGMAPGINHYTQWSTLANKLVSKGGAVFDGDFSRFDASEQPWVHEVILDTINRWYRVGGGTDEDDLVRRVLWQDLVHSVHLTGNGNSLSHLVQWHKSLPSGHPLTTVVNSMYSLLALTACYIHLTGDAFNMWDHAFINTFGDDNITGVDDSVKEVFNQVTVENAMRELFNLTYTAGAKDGKLVPYTTIDKVTFLKRSFAPDEDDDLNLIGGAPCLGWVAPLAKESFLFTPYFYRNNKDPLSDVEDNIKILQGELSLHSVEDWEVYNAALSLWCSKNNVQLPFSSRIAARTYIKTRFDVWF